MVRRVGLRAFPRRGRAQLVNGDVVAAIQQLMTVPLNRVIFYSKRKDRDGHGPDGLAEYLREIAVSHPRAFAKLIAEVFKQGAREEFREKGLPIPREFRCHL